MFPKECFIRQMFYSSYPADFLIVSLIITSAAKMTLEFESFFAN